MYGEESNSMMMLEDRFFDQEWVQELSNEDFRMLLYLLHFASKKTGIIELNMRQINFTANTGKQYTKAEILKRFSNMITLIPGKENTAIFHDYIATNWAKNGKPIDVIRNPLFKSVVAELGSFGLSIDDVNSMAKKKIVVAGSEQTTLALQAEDKPEDEADVDKLFDGFWSAYPSECPRKTDKKKCKMKFASILGKSKDKVQMFNKIMNGLDVWKKCQTWTRDNGQYIRAPLVWLNNENWNDKPTGGNGNGNPGKCVATSNANFKSADAVGIF